MASGKNRRLTFGVSDDGVMSTGLLCGGEIVILVEAVL
jgi:xanthine/CO dehydrogenase XdhC/CoxF family maturation factor